MRATFGAHRSERLDQICQSFEHVDCALKAISIVLGGYVVASSSIDPGRLIGPCIRHILRAQQSSLRRSYSVEFGVHFSEDIAAPLSFHLDLDRPKDEVIRLRSEAKHLEDVNHRVTYWTLADWLDANASLHWWDSSFAVNTDGAVLPTSEMWEEWLTST